MTSFKDLGKNETADNAYSGKVVIYLESQEDVEIIKERWFFDEGEKLEFKSVDEGEGGGCRRVIEKVKAEREERISAFGIIDRDSVMQVRNWDLWWEVDDKKFKQAKPFGEYVRVLQRWELENYLLSPKELAEAKNDKTFSSTNNQINMEALLLTDSSDYKLLSAAAMLAHGKQLSFSNCFGLGKSGSELEQAVDTHLSKNINQSLNQLKECIQEIIDPFIGASTQYWKRLNRLLDGKCVLYRLDLYDRRLEIARNIKNNNNVDPELKEYIEEFKKANLTQKQAQEQAERS